MGLSQAFLALATGRVEPKEALKSGEIRIEGEPETLARCLEIFGLTFMLNEKTEHQARGIPKNV